VLGCFAVIVNRLKARVDPHVGRVFEATFEPTLAMITGDFNSYPEHRLKFFALLHAITQHCFAVVLRMTAPQVKLVIDSIVWAFRHTERNVADEGLTLLLGLLENFSRSPELATPFYRAYYLQLLREVRARALLGGGGAAGCFFCALFC
jgi:exportin-1